MEQKRRRRPKGSSGSKEPIKKIKKMDWASAAKLDTTEPDCLDMEGLVDSKKHELEPEDAPSRPTKADRAKAIWLMFSLARQLAQWGIKCLERQIESPDEFPTDQEEILMKEMEYRISDLKPDLIRLDIAALKRLGLIVEEYNTGAEASFKKGLMSSLQKTYSSIYEKLKGQLKTDAGGVITDPVIDEYKRNPDSSTPIDDYLQLEKDVYSLTTINSKINQFLQKCEEGKFQDVPNEYDLSLQRVFQHAGEFTKNTKDTPNLSSETRESLVTKGVPVDALGELRDMLAHYQLYPMIHPTEGKRKVLEDTWRGVERILENEIVDLEGAFFEKVIKQNTKDSMKQKVEELLGECEIKSVACLKEKVKSKIGEADWQDAWDPQGVKEITQYEERMKSRHFPEHKPNVNDKFEEIPDTKKAIVDFATESKRKLYDKMHEELEKKIDEPSYPIVEEKREKIKELLNKHENEMEIIKVKEALSHGGSIEGLEAFFMDLPSKCIVNKEKKIIKVKETFEKYFDADEFTNNSGDWVLPDNDMMSLARRLLEGTGEQGDKVMRFLEELRNIQPGDVTNLKPKDYDEAVGSLKDKESQGTNKVLSQEEAEKLYSVSLQWRKDKCAKLLTYYLDVIPLYNDILGNDYFLKKMDIDEKIKIEIKGLSDEILPIAEDLFEERIKIGISTMIPLENPSALESQVVNVLELLKRSEQISKKLKDKFVKGSNEQGSKRDSGERKGNSGEIRGNSGELVVTKEDITKFRNYLCHGDALATAERDEEMGEKLVELKDNLKEELERVVDEEKEVDLSKVGEMISEIFPKGAMAMKNILCRNNRRTAREVESCLTWEDIEEVAVDKEGPIDPDNIKIDSEKMMEVLARESHTNEEKYKNYVALAEESEMKGYYKNEVVRVIHHEETYGKHLENVEGFSESVMDAMMAKHILGELLRGDYRDVAMDVGFLGGSFVLGKIAKFVGSRGAEYALEGSSVLGGSLKLASPLLARGASVFVVYDLYNQIKALESGDREAIVNVVSDGIQLAVDATEVGVQVAEGLSLVEGVSAVTGPIGMAIGAAVFVGTDIYRSVKAVQNIEKTVNLNGLEEFTEGVRSFFEMNPSDYIGSIIEVKQRNNAAVESARTFLRDNTNIKRYIFPSYEQDDDCYEPMRALNSTVSLHYQMNIIELSRTSPDDAPYILCKPEGEGGGAVVATCLCKNAIGVEYLDDRTGSYTLINMGRGHVAAEGSLEDGNIFIINAGNQISTGGNKDDTFILHWDPSPILVKKVESCKDIIPPGRVEFFIEELFAPIAAVEDEAEQLKRLEKPDPKVITLSPLMVGSINGGRGTDTVDVEGLVGKSSATSYVWGPSGTWTLNEVVADFPRKSLTYAGLASIEMNDIEKYLGKAGTPDRVTADCNTAFINGRGGYDAWNQDTIKIPNLNCSYNTTIIMDPHTTVTNEALTGDFRYFIRGNFGTSSDINMEATSKSSHTINIQYSLHDLAAIVKFKDTLKLCFVEDFYNRFDNVKPENSFNLTITNRFEGHTYMLMDSTRIVAGKRNFYAMHKTERPIEGTVEAYNRLAVNLDMYLVVQSTNEVLTVTGPLNDVLTNDPTSGTSHFVSGSGENVFSLVSGRDNKLTMDKLRINDVIIHYFSKENSVDRFDLRKIINQVRKDLEKEVTVVASRDGEDSKLNLFVSHDFRDYELLEITLKGVLDESEVPTWKRKIHIVTDTVYSIQVSDGHFEFVPEPLIFDDPRDKLFVINPRDVAKGTKIKISKEMRTCTFARKDKALIITNALNDDSHRYQPLTVVLHSLYTTDDDSHCSEKICAKMRSLVLEFDDKTIDLRKEINKIFTAEDYLRKKEAVETESHRQLIQAIRLNRRLFGIIDSISGRGEAELMRALRHHFPAINGWVNPLAHAVIEGEAAAVELLVEIFGSKITEKDIYGHSALYYAVKYQHQEIIDYFLHTLSMKHNTDEDLAAITSELFVVKYLTDTRKTEAGRDEFNENIKHTGSTLLHLAAINGNLESVEYLLKKGGYSRDIDAEDQSGQIALYYAVKYNHSRVVDLFIETIRSEGWAPLSFGIAHGNGGMSIVKYLVEKKGADIYEKDKYWKTPVYYALRTGVADDYLIEIVKDNKEGRGLPLIYSIIAGDVGLMESMIRYFDSHDILSSMIHGTDQEGKTPLHYAAMYGNLEMVKKLVGGDPPYVVDTRHPDDSGHTPLDYALKNQHAEVVEYLCEKQKLEPLWSAAAAGNTRLVKHFTNDEADLWETDYRGNTLLHVAAEGRGLDLVKYLLGKELSPNAANSLRRTPLHVAATIGSASIVRMLVSAKADLNAQDVSWKTPLDNALDNHHTQVIIHLCEVYGKDALFVAGQAGCTPTVRYLVENGANIQKTFGEQRTLLHLAADGCKGQLGEYLVNGGIDVNVQDTKGLTPLHIIAQNPSGCTTNTQFAQFLIRKGVDLNARDNWGWTPLFWVVDKRVNFRLLQLLVENGADLEGHDVLGRTPLSMAEGIDEKSEFTQYLKRKTSEKKHQRGRRQVNANQNDRESISGSSSDIFGTITQALLSPTWINSGFVNWARGLLYHKTNDSSANFTTQFSPQIDTNGTIMLLDLLIRKNTGQKYVGTTGGLGNPLDIQARALNIVRIFEDTLNDAALEFGMDVENMDLDPVALQSKVIRQLQIGTTSEIPKTLYSFARKACSESSKRDEFLEYLRIHLEHGLDES